MKTRLLLFFLMSNLIGQAQVYFPPNSGNTWDTISPQSLDFCQSRIDSMYQVLEDDNTKAFILLKDGKIVLEKYFGSHTQGDAWYWASAGKTLTAFMVGIAQQEGYLSISDTTSDYLGAGWTSCTSGQEERITLWHQLTMTSGLDDGVTDHYCTDDTCLIYKANAGNRWAYHNGPYTLLDEVMENATGQTLNAFTNQKLEAPTGMVGSFLPIGYNNVYFSTARSMARFGILMLNKGNWNGTQIMSDTNYFEEMTNTSQSLNESYGYLWWLNGKSSFLLPGLQVQFPGPISPNAPADNIMALGKNGQFLNVSESTGLVWLRMGDAPGNTDVPYLLNDEIWTHINGLACATTGTKNRLEKPSLVTVYPNPVTDELFIQSPIRMTKIEVYSIHGQLIKVLEMSSKTSSIFTEDLKAGMLLMKIYLSDGSDLVKRIVKE